MRTIAFGSMLLISMGTAFGKTYECDVKSASSFRGGALKSMANASYWLGIIRKVTFDEDSGLFRYGSGNAWEKFTMKVLQRGTKSNDTIAKVSGQGGGRYVLNTLRIRGWEKGAPFVWDNGGDFFAGNCSEQR